MTGPGRNPVSRLGYALVASSLVVWLATASLGFTLHPVMEYSIAGVVLGLAMIVTGALWPARRRKDMASYYITCSQCGWQGDASVWREYEGCPECDSQEGHRTFVH